MEISRNVMLAKMEITEKDGKPVVHDNVFCKADGSLRKMKPMNHVKNCNAIPSEEKSSS